MKINKILNISFVFLFILNFNVKSNEYLFSSESVTEGHPDKVCDQISDAIWDAYIKQDKKYSVACECLIVKNILKIAGEISSQSTVNVKEVAKKTLQVVRYTFALKPAKIIKYLDLKNPIYKKTASYGYFGENCKGLSWENTNYSEALKLEMDLYNP